MKKIIQIMENTEAKRISEIIWNNLAVAVEAKDTKYLISLTNDLRTINKYE